MTEIAGERDPLVHQLSRALAASEDRFRNIIQRLNDGLLVLRLDGSIAYVNPATETLLQQRAADLLGMPFGIPVAAGETVTIDLPTLDDQSQNRVAEMRVTQSEWEGQPAYVAILRDVSEQRKVQFTLHKRVQELSEEDRRKNEFLAMLAHELRNPLAPIRNAVRVLGMDVDDQTRATMRSIIEQQVSHLGRLLDDLLDVSRITRGKITLRRQYADLGQLTVQTVESLRHLIQHQGLELVLGATPGPMPVLVDPVRIEQVIANLIHNALKFTDSGGLIDVQFGSDDGQLSISIRDTGIGIDEETLPRIFDMFAQADGARDRNRGGLGIGLTLVRRLLEMHGGGVEAESKGLGLGSRFTITLPVTLPPSVAEPSDDDHSAPIVPRTTVSRRILIVDDNEAGAQSLKALVRLWGHQVEVAADGVSALEKVKSFWPDVMLLDIGLPGMNGYEVAALLRKDPSHQSLRIIVTSGYGNEDDRSRSRAVGIDHHLIKPLDLDRLRELIV